MKPFVKWVGGKSRFIKNAHLLPERYNTYLEPFVGGGAVLLHLKPPRAVISDVNPELVTAWMVVKCNPDALIARLAEMSKMSCKDYYYAVRLWKIEQLSPIEVAARFIYLNKTGYNGLYRVNRKGHFNTPWGGDDRRTSVYDAENIKEISRYLNSSKIYIECQPFAWSETITSRGDLVYLDPPYAYDDKSTFTSYSSSKFGPEDQVSLFEYCKRLHKRGALVAMSNSNTAATKALIPQGWQFETLTLSQTVGASSRAGVTELLIQSPKPC